MYRIIVLFAGLFLLFFNAKSMAHEGEPNMAFAWRDGAIVVDIQRQSRALGDHKAFVISFTDPLTPYRMGDAGFTGNGFNQGGVITYQTESTLLKWSSEQSQWLQDGFSEQIVISRLSKENVVTEIEGNGLQGSIAKLGDSGLFEAHAVFSIEREDGAMPDDGAYMVFINILGVDETGERILYKPSKPFVLVFHINAQASFDLLALSESLKVAPEVRLNDYSRIDALFNWAESQYQELFPHAVESQFISGFYARCYNNSVCMGSKDGAVFTAGGVSGDIVEHGLIETFYDAAGL